MPVSRRAWAWGPGTLPNWDAQPVGSGRFSDERGPSRRSRRRMPKSLGRISRVAGNKSWKRPIVANDSRNKPSIQRCNALSASATARRIIARADKLRLYNQAGQPKPFAAIRASASRKLARVLVSPAMVSARGSFPVQWPARKGGPEIGEFDSERGVGGECDHAVAREQFRQSHRAVEQVTKRFAQHEKCWRAGGFTRPASRSERSGPSPTAQHPDVLPGLRAPVRLRMTRRISRRGGPRRRSSTQSHPWARRYCFAGLGAGST